MSDYDRCNTCDQPWGTHDDGTHEAVIRGGKHRSWYYAAQIEADRYRAANRRTENEIMEALHIIQDIGSIEKPIDTFQSVRVGKTSQKSWFFRWVVLPWACLGLFLAIPWLYFGCVTLDIVRGILSREKH